jgi:cation diffusion facilitator family transporter
MTMPPDANQHQPVSGRHEHVFLGQGHARNERRTWFVIALTVTMMVVEIAAGTIYGSMALIADGWHMSTHAAAMLIAALAYFYARRNARNPHFTFGTGKLGDLAGFASAIILALIAVLIGYESLLRFAGPIEIDFPRAIGVAVVGLVVNLASAWLLRGDHQHAHAYAHSHANHHGSHGHAHQESAHQDHPRQEPTHHVHGEHDHGPGDHHRDHRHGGDNNLRAAYLHVLADALTSVLAIVALLAGSLYGWLWLDPAMGVVGALVIARWSWGLIRDAGGVLLDYVPASERLPDAILEAITADGSTVTDLHVWQLGPGHHGAIVAIETSTPQPPSHYRRKLSHLRDLSHVTIQVEPA